MAVPCDMLLHPELLTNEQLVLIIRERYLHVSNLDSMRRDELLNLFHNFCVPFGQRKYRDSGRGKILNMARKPSPEPLPKLNTFNNSQYRKSLHSEKSERLKPPPESLSHQLKRIKLDIRTQPVSDINNSKRKMSIDTATLATDSPPRKKDRKAITWP